MANNLHISYDLHDPGRNYHTVIAAVEKLSRRSAKIHYSFWYVRSNYSAEQARDILARAIDANDSVYVVRFNEQQRCLVEDSPGVVRLHPAALVRTRSSVTERGQH